MGSRTYEFMGPHGPLIMIPLLNIGVLLFLTLLNQYSNPEFKDRDTDVKSIWSILTKENLLSIPAILAVFAWILFQLLLYVFLPGESIRGVTLSNGRSLLYPVNGFSSLITTVYAATCVLIWQGTWPFIWIADNILQLCAASCISSFIISLGVYAYSHREHAELSEKGNTRFFAYDFWMGRELNPRPFGVDVKYFFELRPGLIGWALVNFSFLLKGISTNRYLDPSMAFIFMAQGLYVLDALYHEKSILTTMDITTEGFGYMLCMGSLVFEPFFYTVQANYLSKRDSGLSPFPMCLVVLLFLVGYYIFRRSNTQKNDFRRNFNTQHNDVDPADYIISKDGKPLLCAGWWKLARHINYFGDWCASISWCLSTGFGSFVPYLYALYFTTLLAHREVRDEKKCQINKGSAWRQYCRRVPWRVVPYVL